MPQKNRPDLDQSLDAYTAAVKTTSITDWKSRLGSWPVYAAAAGSALALSTSAGASIIHGFANASVTHTGGGSPFQYNSFPIGPASGAPVAYPYISAVHLSSPGVLRFGGVQVHSNCACYGTSFFVRPFSTLAVNYPLRRFASGEMISDGAATTNLAGGGFLAARCAGSTASGCGPGGDFSLHPEFQSGAYGLAGFKVGGNFGWIRLKWEADGSGLPNKLAVLDWAYEDTGAPIAAGDVGAPEPGTASMGLLAAGAAGILAWRKRKKCAA